MYNEESKQFLHYIMQLIILTVSCLWLPSNAGTWHINIECAVTGAFICITEASNVVRPIVTVKLFMCSLFFSKEPHCICILLFVWFILFSLLCISSLNRIVNSNRRKQNSINLVWLKPSFPSVPSLTCPDGGRDTEKETRMRSREKVNKPNKLQTPACIDTSSLRSFPHAAPVSHRPLFNHQLAELNPAGPARLPMFRLQEWPAEGVFHC